MQPCHYVVGDVDASSHEGSLTEPRYDFWEVHASTDIEEVCNEVEKTPAFNTSLDPSYGPNSTNAYENLVYFTHDDYDDYDKFCEELSLTHSSSSTTET
jgi:hypothetical protein